jgi:hypothetical protein
MEELLKYTGYSLYIGLGTAAPYFYRQINPVSFRKVDGAGHGILILLFDIEYKKYSKTHTVPVIRTFFEDLFPGATVSVVKNKVKEYTINVDGRGEIKLFLLPKYLPTNEHVKPEDTVCGWYNTVEYAYETEEAKAQLEEVPLLRTLCKLADAAPKIAINHQAMYSTYYKPLIESMITHSALDYTTHSASRSVTFNVYFDNTAWVLSFIERYPKTHITVGPSRLTETVDGSMIPVVYYGQSDGRRFIQEGCTWKSLCNDDEGKPIHPRIIMKGAHWNQSKIDSYIHNLLLRTTLIDFRAPRVSEQLVEQSMEQRVEQRVEQRAEDRPPFPEIPPESPTESQIELVRNYHRAWLREKELKRKKYRDPYLESYEKALRCNEMSPAERMDKIKKRLCREYDQDFREKSNTHWKAMQKDAADEWEIFGRWRKWLPKLMFDDTQYIIYYQSKRRVSW